MINSIMFTKVRLSLLKTNKNFQEYIKFINTAFKKSKDNAGWLFWAKTRVADVAYLLQGISFQKNWRVLELGARGSAFGAFLASKVDTIIISDNFQKGQSPAHVWLDFNKVDSYGDLKKWKNRWMAISSNPEITRCLNIDCRSIPYKDNSFDCVFAISVIEHIKDKDGYTGEEDLKALKEMERVVKPGGIVAITTDFSKEDKCRKGRTRRYTEKSIIELINKTNLKFITKEYNYKTNENSSGCLILKKEIKND